MHTDQHEPHARAFSVFRPQVLVTPYNPYCLLAPWRVFILLAKGAMASIIFSQKSTWLSHSRATHVHCFAGANFQILVHIWLGFRPLALFRSVVPPTQAISREVRLVRRDTRLTIRVTVWGWGSCGTKSQRLRGIRCRTQPRLSPLPERTGKRAPLAPFYSITVRVVQFFGRSSCSMWQPWPVGLRLTFLWSIGFGSDRTHGIPVRTRAPESPNLSSL